MPKSFSQSIGEGFSQASANYPNELNQQRALLEQRRRDALAQQENFRIEQARNAEAARKEGIADERYAEKKDLEERKFAFEQNKFNLQNPQFSMTPEERKIHTTQQANAKEDALKEKTIRAIYGASDTRALPYLGNKKFTKQADEVTREAATEIGKFQNSRFGINFLTNNIPDALSKGVKSRGNLFEGENREHFLNSGLFDDIARKKGYNTPEKRQDFREEFGKYLQETKDKADAVKDTVNQELKVSSHVDAQTKLFENALEAVSSSDPKASTLKLLKEYARGKFEPGEMEAMLDQIENKTEILENQEQSQDQVETQQLQGNSESQQENKEFRDVFADALGIPRDGITEEDRIQQRNEIIDQNINKALDERVDQLMPPEVQKKFEAFYGISPQEAQQRIDEQKLGWQENAEPIRKLSQGMANWMNYDPKILQKAQTVMEFEKEHPYQSFMMQLPAQAFLYMGGEKALASGVELAAKGVSEKFLMETAISALSTGGIDKLSGESFAEGALLGAAIPAGARGIKGAYNAGKAAKEGDFAVKDIGKYFNPSNEKVAKNLEREGEKYLKQQVETSNKALDEQATKVVDEEVKPIIEKNVDLTKDLNPEIVKGFQETGKDYLKSAQENYAKSKEFARDLTKGEREQFIDQVIDVSEGIKQENKTNITAVKDLEKIETQLSNIETYDDAINAIKSINRDFAKSDNSFYQEIAKKYKPIIEDLINQIDGGYYKLGNKYFKNLKEFEKRLKTDNMVSDSFKFAEDISELGNSDLVKLNNLNNLHAPGFKTLLKDKNLQKFNLTTLDGLRASIDQSLQDVHKSLKNPNDFNKALDKFDKELDGLQYRLKEHPEIQKHYEKIRDDLRKHSDSIEELKNIQKLNNKALEEFKVKTADEFFKNPEKVINDMKENEGGDLLKKVGGSIPIIGKAIETTGEFGSKLFNYFSNKQAISKLKEIAAHRAKNENNLAKFKANVLAEDIKGQVKKLRDTAEQTLNKSKAKLEKLTEGERLAGSILKAARTNTKEGK